MAVYTFIFTVCFAVLVSTMCTTDSKTSCLALVQSSLKHHSQPGWTIPAADVAAAIITDPNMEPYASRAASVRRTWAPYFDAFEAFTFNTTAKGVRHVNKYADSEQVTGLHLAALPELYSRHPDSQWYLIGDDDTWLLPHQLKLALGQLDPSQKLIAGKCVGYKPDNVAFCVGGAGIVISRAMMQELVPHVHECRQRYNQWDYGDAKIGGCIKHFVVGHPVPPEWSSDDQAKYDKDSCVKCLPGFTNYLLEELNADVVGERKEQLPVSLHLKDPQILLRLFDAFRKRVDAKSPISWSDLVAETDGLRLAAPPSQSLLHDPHNLETTGKLVTARLECRLVTGTSPENWLDVCK